MNERSRIHVYEYKILGNVEASQTTRIPRDITCSFIQRCFIDKYLHVFRAGRKRGNRASPSIDRASIFETDPRARRGIDFSRERVVRATATRENGEVCGARPTPFAYRTKSSFIKILRLHFTGEAERKNAGVARLPRPPPPLLSLYMEI